jgi:hypothetical protein
VWWRERIDRSIERSIDQEEVEKGWAERWAADQKRGRETLTA